jgi:hypothetical protein
MTLIIEYVNATIFKEIHKIHPASIINIDYVFPEHACIDVILVPGKLVFEAKLDLCEKPSLLDEIEQLTDADKQGK